MNQALYKLIFVLLIISILSAEVEISFVVGMLALIFGFRKKLSTNLLYVLIIFGAIFFIGLLGLFRFDMDFRVYFMDIIYFSRPIIVLVAAYNLVKIIKDKEFIFKSFIALGFASAIYHLFVLGINLDKISTVVQARSIGGRYNHLELVAIIIISIYKNRRIRDFYGMWFYKFLIFVLLISTILYFSRVMFAVYFIFILGYKGYLNLSSKGIKAILLGTLTITIFLFAINQFKVDSNDSGLKGFIFKIQNSYSEIFTSLDLENIKRDRRDLWKHWRGYEAQSAIEQIDEAGISAWLFGKGFGSQVDLGTNVQLSGESVRYIPILHNGYIYVLLKSGLIGLMLFMFYIFYLYSFSRAKTAATPFIDLNKFLIGCTFYVAISSLVVSGVYKPYDYSTLLVGAILSLKSIRNESWNPWN